MKSSSTRAFVLGGLLSAHVSSFGATPPASAPVQLTDFQGLSKAQAKSKFKALRDDAVIVLADGRKLTKRELAAAASRKRKPDFGAAAPAGQAAALAQANAILKAAQKAKADESVRASFDEYRRLGKPALTCPAPRIDSVFPLSSFTPGGGVLVKGCGFGSSPGEFALVLSQSGTEIPLGSLQWAPTGVAGIIPAEHPVLKTAATQPAVLKVKLPGGTASSGGVTYRAGREVRPYPFSLVTRVVSTESDDDRCYDWAGGGKGICTHYTGPWDPLGGDKGTDHFTVTLKNGWTLHSWGFKSGDGAIGWEGRDEGKSVAKNSVSWNTICGDGCNCYYYIDVLVEGEIGTLPW